MYYHVCVVTHSRRSYRTIELDLDSKQRACDFLAPYVNGGPIIFSNGESVSQDDVCKIVVGESKEIAADVKRQIEIERQGKTFIGPAAREPLEWAVPFKGFNVTGEILTALR